MGLWYEYAPLITSLIREGFTPSSIEEATGISGVEQNRFVVAAQVRDSLVQSNSDPDILSFFDSGGSELLYEIRLLSAPQRAAAARFIVENKFDEELKGKGEKEEKKEGEIEQGVRVPVVRLRIGEVAEASSVVVLPVCRAEEGGKGVVEAPWECTSEGEFGVVVAEKGWERWVVLPGWEPVVLLGKGGIVVSFPDARVLPWKVNRWYKEEPILVVADRSKKTVGADNGFYLVAVDEGLKVERGSALKNVGVEESLGTLVLVVRPPKDEVDDQLSDEDWE
ncbi:rubisco accumulation factor 1.1, chloroplastic-like [Senna tora]|uniref:Rubisco accumulation factor 1.1, chloroplastic-like n=1 Tax=Senna tora TaxID=362788 RepID=A0A834T998_9FABA|nr:rubisco accumulation factor 1.1, chloroplastic-like [Senna tora]